MLVQGMGTAVYIIELAVLLWVSQSKYKKQYYVQSKMLCSVTFVVLAVIFALVSHHLEYFFGLFPALCFCMLGDLFMGLYQIERRRRNLILGILTFMLGHLFLLILLPKQGDFMVECLCSGCGGDFTVCDAKDGRYAVRKGMAAGDLLLYFPGTDVV